MRAHEIIQDYIDPRKIPLIIYNEIVDTLKRTGATPASSEFIQLMYCDRREELELEQLQLDLARTRAEVKNMEAEAARDRAATRRELAGAEDDNE
jgi:hypothetical protein